MRLEDLEHLIRAAGAIIADDEIIVAGSQAALASLAHRDDLPPEMVESMELDLIPRSDADGRKADLIDGTIGDGSIFQESFGVYAHGISESTLRLPRGWRDRLVALSNVNTGGVTGHCLDLHDLFIAKLLANRDKDRDFCDALVRFGAIDAEVVAARLAETDCRADERTRILRRLQHGRPPAGSAGSDL